MALLVSRALQQTLACMAKHWCFLLNENSLSNRELPQGKRNEAKKHIHLPNHQLDIATASTPVGVLRPKQTTTTERQREFIPLRHRTRKSAKYAKLD